MAQAFYPTFDPNDQVQITMGQIFDDVNTLRSKFSGSANPASPVPFQWWVNTSSDILFIRNEANTAWIAVYDLSAEQVILKNEQVTSAIISDSARKGTIVSGEAIAPASCALRATFKNVSMPHAANELFSLVTGFGTLTGGSWRALYTTRLNVPSESGWLYVTGRQTTCNMRFILGGQTSDNSGSQGPTAWGAEAKLNTSSMGGWKDFVVECNTTQGTSPYGGLSGLASRWMA